MWGESGDPKPSGEVSRGHIKPCVGRRGPQKSDGGKSGGHLKPCVYVRDSGGHIKPHVGGGGAT